MPPKRPESPSPSANTALKKPRTEEQMEDVLSSLREKYPTPKELYKKLSKVDASEVRSALVSTVYPETASQLQHCIYCHKTFDSELSGAYDCKIRHFGEPKDEDEREFTCCGRKFPCVDCDDWGEHLMMPEEEEPYCFEGRHTTVPWKRGDEEVEEDDDYYGDEGEDVDEEGRTRWWEEIWKMVGNCGKLECKKKALL